MALPGPSSSLERSPIPRACLEYAPLPLLVFEGSLRTHFINARARSYFGLAPDATAEHQMTGAESFFGVGVKLASTTEDPRQFNEHGSRTVDLTCHRIPPLSNSVAVPTTARCCISTFLPPQDYADQQLQILRARQETPTPSPTTPVKRLQAPWYIVMILGPSLPEETALLPLGANLPPASFPLFAQNLETRPIPGIGPLDSAKLSSRGSNDSATSSPSGDSFFPPVEAIPLIASKPVLTQRGSTNSNAPSLASATTASSAPSQTPSSIFSTSSRSVSTSASSNAPPIEEPASAGIKSPRSEDSPAARIIAQHRANEAQRRRVHSLNIGQVQTQAASLPPSPSPSYSHRPPLHRARASTGSSAASATSLKGQHSFSYSSGSSATARRPPSESGSEIPITSKESLPLPIVTLSRAMLAGVPLTGLIIIDKECEHGLVNDAAFDILTGHKVRRRAGELKEGTEESVTWSDDGYFSRRRGTPASAASHSSPTDDGGERSSSPFNSPGAAADLSPGLSKLTLGGILNVFMPLEQDDTSRTGGSPSNMASLFKGQKPYRVYDAAFSTRIIDPLESLLDIVARRGETPASLVGSEELTVGIEVDVESEAGQDEAEGYTTIIEQPPPGHSSVQSHAVEHRRVRRRVLFVRAQPINRSDGAHIGGVLMLRHIPLINPTPTTPDPNLTRKSVGEGHFQQILEHLPHLIWTTTPSGSHDYFNEQWYHYTGLEPETSLGLGWKNPFHPDDMPHTLAAWSRSLETGEPYSVEYRCRRRDGAYRWMLGRANCLRDHITGEIIGWFGSCTDIEEAVTTRQELKRVQKDMDAVLKGADLALVNFDKDLRLKGVRGAMGEAILKSPTYLPFGESSIGKPYQELVEPGAWERFELGKKTGAILSGKEDLILFDYDRTGHHYRVSMTPKVEIRADGSQDIVGVITVLVDVTDLKQTVEALENAKADHARSVIEEAAAKQASQMKTEFLSTVNHELRTPISAIMGLSELLLDDNQIQSTSRDYVQKIVRSSEALLQMIGSILDISKAEAGKLELNPRPFALKEVLEEARIFEVVAQQKGLTYHQELSGTVAYDLTVNGDFGRIRQILNNLLSNAIKFTSKGSILLKVNYEDKQDYVEASFTVTDTGVGIKPETLPTLFQAYQQAPGTSARYGGTGLGLYISKQLAHVMSGDIDFTSVYGQGTTAKLTVPLSKSTTPPSSNSPSTPESGHLSFDRTKTKILVAEDNPVNREVAVRFLQKAGYSVSSVENGQEVLDRVREEHFHLLVMDCGMPQMDGYETARRLRASSLPQAYNLKILALTASAGANDRERCLEAGFNDYLTKPFKGKMLEKTVLDLLFASEELPSRRSSLGGSNP